MARKHPKIEACDHQPTRAEIAKTIETLADSVTKLFPGIPIHVLTIAPDGELITASNMDEKIVATIFREIIKEDTKN